MISLLRSMIIAGVALFATSNVNATPKRTELETEKGIDYGMKYLKANGTSLSKESKLVDKKLLLV